MIPMTLAVKEHAAATGLLAVRLALGLGMIAHAWFKLSVLTLSGFAGYLGSLGVPAPGLMSPLVTFVELLGGALIVAGFLTRPAAALLALILLVASFTAHAGRYFAANDGMELALNMAVTFLALALLGPGKYSLDRRLSAKKA